MTVSYSFLWVVATYSDILGLLYYIFVLGKITWMYALGDLLIFRVFIASNVMNVVFFRINTLVSNTSSPIYVIFMAINIIYHSPISRALYSCMNTSTIHLIKPNSSLISNSARANIHSILCTRLILRIKSVHESMSVFPGPTQHANSTVLFAPGESNDTRSINTLWARESRIVA